MSKSRMFDDDAESPNPSPRTTIVGGRPPEETSEAYPVPTGIQVLLRLAAEDPGFKRELIERRAELAGPAGVKLTESEKSILKVIPEDQLSTMIDAIPPAPAPRRDFLRQTAATAVLLLGGAALDGCDSCISSAGGARPDLPEENPASQGSGQEVPPRPDERPSPPGGARPDLPKPKPQPKPQPSGEKPDTPFAKPPPGWEDGGTPKPPPEPEPPPVRPDHIPKTRGIRPDRPRPTRGSRPDVPAKKPGKKDRD